MGVLNCLKRFFRAVVPHIIVLAMLFGYLIFGAAVFSYLETGSSDLEMYVSELGKLRELFTGQSDKGPAQVAPPPPSSAGAGVPGYGQAPDYDPLLTTMTPAAPVDMNLMVDELMDKSLRPEWKVGRMQAVQSERAWSFASSMLFCLTTITTIGYGDVVPVTTGGKVFCVIYSTFGIPLTMLYLAGVGTFLAHLILTLCKILNLGQPIRKAVCTCGPCRGGGGGPDDGGSYEDVRQGKGEPAAPPPDGGDDAAEKGAVAPGHGPGPEETAIVTRQHGSGSVEDELEAPVVMVLGILAGYMCAGAFMMSGIEDWTFGEGLYFTFITLTTIGFGDYVPVMLYKEDAFFVCMVYALFGLAVMSMCIALLQAKVRRCGSRLWKCIGC